MSDKNNKVKYNLKNAHYALLTVGEDGAVSYAAQVPLPGGCYHCPWMPTGNRRILCGWHCVLCNQQQYGL